MRGALAALGGLALPSDLQSKISNTQLYNKRPDPAAQKKPVAQQSQLAVPAKPRYDDRLIVMPNVQGKMLLDAARSQNIRGVELAQFLAQTEHESLDFKKTKEIGKPRYFNQYDPKHNPAKARDLGNKYRGDGLAFRGRGFIQITGRENYTRVSRALFGDDRLVKKPDLVSTDPDIAAKVAVWFWQTRVKPFVQDFTDTERVTRLINGGYRGLEDRKTNFAKYLNMMTDKSKPSSSSGKSVDENLDADQRRVGQLGPMDRVGPQGAVGKLVGGGG